MTTHCAIALSSALMTVFFMCLIFFMYMLIRSAKEYETSTINNKDNSKNNVVETSQKKNKSESFIKSIKHSFNNIFE